MPRKHDRSRDYRLWSAREPVRLIQSMGGTHNITHALRVPPKTREERSPSGGRYLARTMKWLIPGRLVMTVELLPGDVVEADTVFRDTLGTRALLMGMPAKTNWVSQRIEHNHFDDVWTLDCLNLSIHPRLFDRLTIQRQVLVDGFPPLDDAGGELVEWYNVYTNIPCSAILTGEEDAEVNAQIGSTEHWELTIGQQVEMTGHDRVLLFTEGGVGTGTDTAGALILDFKDIQGSGLIDELPRLICTRNP